AAGLADFLDHLAGRRGIFAASLAARADVVDDDLGAVRRQHERVLAAEPAPRAGDDRNAALAQTVHAFPPSGCRFGRRLHDAAIGRNMRRNDKGIGMTRMVDVKELPDLVGKEVGVSDWVKVDQDRIDRFADLCGDHQWIHVDVERANREIGGTIAHGFLTMSLMSTMSAQIMRVKDVKRGLNYGFNKLRFTGVVPAGSEIRMRLKIAAVEPKAGGLAIT